MDKFRITYRCHTQPDRDSDLNGFEKNEKYIGRTYNGFFEISPNWGGEHQTKLITKTSFERYFKLLVPKKEVIPESESETEIRSNINTPIQTQNSSENKLKNV